MRFPFISLLSTVFACTMACSASLDITPLPEPTAPAAPGNDAGAASDPAAPGDTAKVKAPHKVGAGPFTVLAPLGSTHVLVQGKTAQDVDRLDLASGVATSVVALGPSKEPLFVHPASPNVAFVSQRYASKAYVLRADSVLERHIESGGSNPPQSASADGTQFVERGYADDNVLYLRDTKTGALIAEGTSPCGLYGDFIGNDLLVTRCEEHSPTGYDKNSLSVIVKGTTTPKTLMLDYVNGNHTIVRSLDGNGFAAVQSTSKNIFGFEGPDWKPKVFAPAEAELGLAGAKGLFVARAGDTLHSSKTSATFDGTAAFLHWGEASPTSSIYSVRMNFSVVRYIDATTQSELVSVPRRNPKGEAVELYTQGYTGDGQYGLVVDEGQLRAVRLQAGATATVVVGAGAGGKGAKILPFGKGALVAVKTDQGELALHDVAKGTSTRLSTDAATLLVTTDLVLWTDAAGALWTYAP